jgi:Tfp pilus assembly protein PilO
MSSAFRQSSWTVTLPLAAIAVAYVSLVWLPGRRAILEVQEQVETKRQFVSQATELSQALAISQRELDKAEAVVARWEQASPQKRTIPAFYGKINALAKDAGLAIARFDPQAFVVHEKIEEIPITVGCSGGFAQVFDFLRGIEQLPATVWVESIKLEKSDKDTKDVRCELDLVVFSDNPRSSDYTKRAD